ncbi:unnamed protein product, partial [Didymodactylos carnosus]
EKDLSSPGNITVVLAGVTVNPTPQEEIMWPEDGEVWFNHETKQQRQQFIRSTPSHSRDSAKHKQMITDSSEQIKEILQVSKE